MAEKKYYWLKLGDEFFGDKTIKKLRKIAGGDTYTIIYLKMLLLAVKQNNRLYFEGVEETFRRNWLWNWTKMWKMWLLPALSWRRKGF